MPCLKGAEVVGVCAGFEDLELVGGLHATDPLIGLALCVCVCVCVCQTPSQQLAYMHMTHLWVDAQRPSFRLMHNAAI